jgi:L,D-transpeptidase YcbB
MVGRLFFAFALIIFVPVLSGGAAPAWSQAAPAKSAKAARVIDLDAGPSGDSAPDPLTPPEVTGPAPAAPGAPPVAAPEAKPAAEVDPIVVQVRQRLAAAPAVGSDADRADHTALVEYYAGGPDQPIWTSKDGFTPRAQQALAEIRKADDWGLKASAFDLPTLQQGSASVETLADAEIKLGRAVLKYGRHARGGRVEPVSISRLFDQKPTIYDPKTLMQAIAAAEAADAYLRNLHPKHPQFERLRQAMLAARGAKPDEPPPAVRIPAGPQIKPGQEHEQVALLRQRLETPAPEGGRETEYDEALVNAVKVVQAQAGLKQTGIVNDATRNALNGVARPAPGSNVQRLIVNMERWRWLPENLGPFYVWDSVPEQMASVYHNGNRLLHERMVVGKPSSPTPMFSADMQFVIFHPSWGVPPGMKMHELAPALRSAGGGWFFSSGASSVLAAHGLRVSRGGQPVNPDSVDWSSVDIRSYDFTQPPGPTNVLGNVKFRFPNKHDVYMHDTPERHLFGGAVRAFSHGCMRVQNPIKLAEVLLAHDKGWSAEQVREHSRRGGEIKLTNPIPVHITYFTAVVDEAGKVHTYPDLYALDSKVASRLEGQSVSVATVAAAPAGRSEAASDDSGDQQPARARSTARRKPKEAQPQYSNPFATLFGN